MNKLASLNICESLNGQRDASEWFLSHWRTEKQIFVISHLEEEVEPVPGDDPPALQFKLRETQADEDVIDDLER